MCRMLSSVSFDIYEIFFCKWIESSACMPRSITLGLVCHKYTNRWRVCWTTDKVNLTGPNAKHACIINIHPVQQSFELNITGPNSGVHHQGGVGFMNSNAWQLTAWVMNHGRLTILPGLIRQVNQISEFFWCEGTKVLSVNPDFFGVIESMYCLLTITIRK